jgi:hypothetical protein
VSTWVIRCVWISDADLDRGWPTAGMQEVEASSRKAAFAAIHRRFGDRLISIDRSNVMEWKSHLRFTSPAGNQTGRTWDEVKVVGGVDGRGSAGVANPAVTTKRSQT